MKTRKTMEIGGVGGTMQGKDCKAEVRNVSLFVCSLLVDN